jgi:cell shape-determining protein MreD
MPVALIILPLGIIVYFTVGYASITTLSIAVFAMLVFGIKYLLDPNNPDNPLPYVLYGLFPAALLAWALRPNIIKLFSGNERVIPISLHAWWKNRKEKK